MDFGATDPRTELVGRGYDAIGERFADWRDRIVGDPRREWEDDLVSRLEVHAPGENESLLEYPCWAAPILSHGLLYLRGKDRLVCLELIPEKKP